MTEGETLLRCSDLEVRIGDRAIVRGLNLAIERGQCWCLLGRNGSGKTTLLHTLAGLRRPGAGQVLLDGRSLAALRRRQVARQLGLLFQERSDSFPASVREKILQGRHPHLHAWQWETPHDRAIVEDLIQSMGLKDLAERNIQTLSGGERQRVAIATVQAQDCELLLLDEPTNHLDLRHRLGLLKKLTDDCRSRNRALVMSLHDANLANRFCDHALLLMGDGSCRHGPCDTLLDSQLLESLYGYPLEEVWTERGRAWIPR
jgi:iron complex transport system ATP-binding protein